MRTRLAMPGYKTARRIGQNYIVLNLGCGLRLPDRPTIERVNRTREEVGIEARSEEQASPSMSS